MTQPEAAARDREFIQRLNGLAFMDPLTGLHSRGALKELLASTLECARARGESVGLIYIDLVDFRAVNELHSQAVGDVIISRVANRIRSVAQDADLVVRMGGDEFLVAFRGMTPAEDFFSNACRLAEAVDEPYVLEDGSTILLSACVGVSRFPRDSAEQESLLSAAEMALHQAEEMGIDVVLFEPEMLAAEHKRRVLEHDIGLALDRRELSIAFQPQADSENCEVNGFEVLVRWKHPELGQVSPSDFIPAAEASGAISKIGAFVLLEACREAASWAQPLSIAVNVSAAQITKGDFIRVVRNALSETGLSPERLEIEVTESLFIQNSAYASKMLAGVKELGVSVALDDFGTGYSSLSTLRAFPFDRIKIDRSFVFDMVHTADAAAIVNSVISLGHAMRLTVIAEGVETQEQFDLLRSVGCHVIQGYLIGKPMPSDFYANLTGAAIASQDCGPASEIAQGDVLRHRVQLAS